MNWFLPSRLTEAELDHLRSSQDQLGGAGHKSLPLGQEQLLRQFINLKHLFEGPSINGDHPSPNWINLPPGIGIPDERKLIRAGQLGITWYGKHLQFIV